MRLATTLPSLGKPTNRVAGYARFGLALLVLVAIALAAGCSRTRQEKTLAASRVQTKAVRLLFAGDVMLGRGVAQALAGPRAPRYFM